MDRSKWWLFGLAVGANIGTAVATCGLIIVWQRHESWLGFAGGVVGGAIGGALTIAAGFLAWIGVQQQIAAAKMAEQEKTIRACAIANFYAQRLLEINSIIFEKSSSLCTNDGHYSSEELAIIVREYVSEGMHIGRDVESACAVLPFPILDAIRALQVHCAETDRTVRNYIPSLQFHRVKQAAQETISAATKVMKAVEDWSKAEN